MEHTESLAAHAPGAEDVRYVRRRYLTPAVAQALAVGIANATFDARQWHRHPLEQHLQWCFTQPVPRL